MIFTRMIKWIAEIFSGKEGLLKGLLKGLNKRYENNFKIEIKTKENKMKFDISVFAKNSILSRLQF